MRSNTRNRGSGLAEQFLLLKHLPASAGFLLAASLTTTAVQAEMAERSGVIEEVVVTGTKREQSSQDVPIAITALSEEALKRQYRNDILAIGEMSPGVTLGQTPGFRAVAGGIRGTGQNSILVTQDSSVVLLVDEFALSNVQAQFVEMFDLERVEVYRGPQGTLFGKSATGGAISIITKRPEMNEYQADLEYQYGVFNGDDGPSNSDIKKLKVAVNVPLVEDKLSLRAVGIWDQDEGFYTNDKRTATFPNSVPFYDIIGLGVGTNPPLPPELDTRAFGSGEKLNGTDIFAGKLKLLWQPNDRYEAYFLFDYLEDESGTVPGINESEPNMLLPLLGFPAIQQVGHDDVFSTNVTNQCIEGNPDGLCLPANQRVNVKGFQLHQTLALDNYTVKLLAGMREQEEILPNTYTGEAFTSLFDASRNTTKDDTQIELRVSSQLDGPFNFVVGASYSESEVDMLAYTTVGLSGLITFVDEDRNDGVPGPVFRPDGFLNLDLDFINDPTSTGASQDRETLAFYADGTYDVTDRFSISAGIRYTEDKKDFFRRANPGGPCTAATPSKDQVLVNGVCLDARSNAISRVGGGFSPKDLDAFTIPLPDSAFEIAGKFNEKWDEITFRIVADYDISDNGMVYLSYATGFIPGGFTETCSTAQTCVPFDSETNWNAEIGFKGQFLDNRLQANAAFFYTEYEDLIRSQVVPFTNIFGVTTQETINVNAGTSQAMGFEGELTWLPTPNLQISLNGAWLDHEYDEFELNGNDLSNLDVPFSPELKLGGSVIYDQMVSFGRFTYGTSFSYQDEAEMSVFNSPLTQMDDRFLWDANLTFTNQDERWFATLWVKNLLDERFRIGANSVAGLWNFTMYGRPRSYGVEVGVSF